MAKPSKRTITEINCRDWTTLPDDVTASFLSLLGTVEILETAQMVCMKWRRICKQNPNMWRTIHMCDIFRWDSPGLMSNCYPHKYAIHSGWKREKRKRRKRINMLSRERKHSLSGMCYRAIDLGCGSVVDVSIQNFGTDRLLKYITDRSREIRRLRIVASKITSEGLIEAASKLPLLEDLEISYCAHPPPDCIRVIGLSCPLLKSFKLNEHDATKEFIGNANTEYTGNANTEYIGNALAIAIAETMPGLKQLQMFGTYGLDDKGVLAILDGCPLLESLDLRRCPVDTCEGDWVRRCSERIKTLRLPWDSDDDYELLATEKLYQEDWSRSIAHWMG